MSPSVQLEPSSQGTPSRAVQASFADAPGVATLEPLLTSAPMAVVYLVVVPLVLRLLWLVHRRRFHGHRRLARITFPIWAYVSVSGLTVYVLLYQVYGYL